MGRPVNKRVSNVRGFEEGCSWISYLIVVGRWRALPSSLEVFNVNKLHIVRKPGVRAGIPWRYGGATRCHVRHVAK